MLKAFERLLAIVVGSVPSGNATEARTNRRKFLRSAFRIGVGLATLQFTDLLRPSGAKAGGGGEFCPCCYKCDCCETANYWLYCEPTDAACEGGGQECWTSEFLECEGTCCDWICPEEGFCCTFSGTIG